jgi:hypothetical protein
MDAAWVEWSAEINRRLGAIEAKHKTLLGALPEAMARTAADIVERRLTAGIWDATKDYRRGSLVTHQGAGWVAMSDNRGARPGSADLAWRLAVKSDVAHLKRAVADEVTRQLHGARR